MGPLVLPMIGLAAQILGNGAAQRQARQNAIMDIYGQQIREAGGNPIGLQARQQGNAIANMGNLMNYAPSIAAMALSGNDSKQATAKEELAELAEQRANGFKTRPMRAYEF